MKAKDIILLSFFLAVIIGFTKFMVGLSLKTAIIIYLILEATLILLLSGIKIAFKKSVKFKRTDEEMIEAINYVREWWKDKLGTGEDFRIEESEGYEIYKRKKKFYAISITKYGKENKMFVLVGTNPLRVVNYLPYSSIYYSNPIEVIKDVFGVVPTPAPSQKPIEVQRTRGRPRKEKEIEWDKEDEILKAELKEGEEYD